MKILLVGGGSGGPVTPLLAIAEKIKENHPEAQFMLVGTNQGPERGMAEKAHVPFYEIPAGKLRRYWSLYNITSPFLVVGGFFKSLLLIKKIKPDCVIGAGSFVQVPCMWAAFFCRIPILIHQQDVWPTLANKLCSLIASKITVTFETSLKDFPESMGIFYKKPENKVVLTGNPFRESMRGISKEAGLKKFALKTDLPVLYVTGGGTGAAAINSLVERSLPELSKYVQVIHSTGKQKFHPSPSHNYYPSEFISEPEYAFAAADFVLSRAGLSTLTELSNLAKISIIIPMPGTHQEYNAELLANKKAAVVLHQEAVTPELFVKLIRKLLMDGEWQKSLSKNIKEIMPPSAAKHIAEFAVQLAER
jgi:UDP-N-acetylglucosamine--N-acetylmuramyl-(pentapeptide) pyrophosphoryl-undecaprenol N-acetylglucosamine transferase